MRFRAALALGFALGLAVASLGACSGDGGGSGDRSPTSVSVAPAVDEARAIEIAAAELGRTEPGFDRDATRPVVVATAQGWDVGFPDTDPTVLNGEPHVVVDTNTGAIVARYRTR